MLEGQFGEARWEEEHKPTIEELQNQVKWLHENLDETHRLSDRLAKQYELLLDYIIIKEKYAESERRCDALADEMNKLYNDNWKLSAELERMKIVTCDTGCKPPSFNTSTSENVSEVSATNYQNEGCCCTPTV